MLDSCSHGTFSTENFIDYNEVSWNICIIEDQQKYYKDKEIAKSTEAVISDCGLSYSIKSNTKKILPMDESVIKLFKNGDPRRLIWDCYTCETERMEFSGEDIWISCWQ